VDQPDDAPVFQRWPLYLWGLTTLTLLALARAQDTVIRLAVQEYHQYEMKALPWGADLLVGCRTALWILPIAASLSGVRFVWRADPVKMNLWAIVIVLLTLLYASVVGVALFSPFFRITPSLSK
jgi:hypothetical protein